MQRNSRLSSATPSRLPWRLSVGLALLLGTGAVLAMGIAVSQHTQHGARIVSSTHGALAPGDYREITADGPGTQRYYRISRDADGRVIEVYKENQQQRPIDGNVRAWLSDLVVVADPPPPPALPLLPNLAPPPLPPPPPRITDARAFKELFASVSADPRVTGTLGSPVDVVTDSVDGSMNLPDAGNADGDANLRFVLSGPKGRAKVRVAGARHAGVWRVSALEVGAATR